MKYSTEPRFRKFVKGYGFLSFARKFGNKYGKKLMDTSTKTGMDAAKTQSKTIVQKTAEATGDLIQNKIADKTTSLGKPKEKEKTKKIEETYIPPEKRQQIIDDLRLFSAQNLIPLYKNDISKNFLDTTSDDKNLPRFFTKKWIEVYDQSGENYNINKEIRIKTSMLRSDLCDYSDVHIVVKGIITVANPDNAKRNKIVAFKNNAPFINCILKINGVKIVNAGDLDVAIPMHNLTEYSKNYRKATGSF